MQHQSHQEEEWVEERERDKQWSPPLPFYSPWWHWTFLLYDITWRISKHKRRTCSAHWLSPDLWRNLLPFSIIVHQNGKEIKSQQPEENFLTPPTIYLTDITHSTLMRKSSAINHKVQNHKKWAQIASLLHRLLWSRLSLSFACKLRWQRHVSWLLAFKNYIY